MRIRPCTLARALAIVILSVTHGLVEERLLNFFFLFLRDSAWHYTPENAPEPIPRACFECKTLLNLQS